MRNSHYLYPFLPIDGNLVFPLITFIGSWGMRGRPMNRFYPELNYRRNPSEGYPLSARFSYNTYEHDLLKSCVSSDTKEFSIHVDFPSCNIHRMRNSVFDRNVYVYGISLRLYVKSKSTGIETNIGITDSGEFHYLYSYSEESPYIEDIKDFLYRNVSRILMDYINRHSTIPWDKIAKYRPNDMVPVPKINSVFHELTMGGIHEQSFLSCS